MIDSRATAQRQIENYALIGNCETAALVGHDGSIDWLCLPRFDSGACFAALLGGPEHGRWLIAPRDPGARVTRRYLDGSLILVTTFETEDGAVELIDFMDTGLRAVAGPDMAVLRTPVPLQGRDFTTNGEFRVGAGDTVPFVLSYSPSHLPLPQRNDPERALRATEAFWRAWSDRCAPAGRWTEAVKRSLTVLKGLTYAPCGIVAAPTTSLPEQAGGVRNWDYRYCWLRDATFTRWRSGVPAIMTRRGNGETGCCALSLAVRINCRSCTDLEGSDA